MSIRIQIPLIIFITLCFLLTNRVILAAAVYVQDDSTDNYVPCGTVKLLEIGDDAAGTAEVKILTEGESCLDSGISPVSTPILPASLPQPAIDEAGVRYIDLAAKATVELRADGSVSANAETTSTYGGTIEPVFDSVAFPNLGGSVVKYTAPTVTDADAVPDSFSYSLTDATNVPRTGVVTITVNNVSDVIIPHEGCTSGGGLNCRGDLNAMEKFPSGLILDQSVASGEIDAWRFTYLKTNVTPAESPRPGAFIVFDGSGKEVSISSVAGDMGPEEADGTIGTQGYPCALWLPNEYSLYFNLADQAGFNECPLVEGGVYYLNIRNREGLMPGYRLDISEH